jgi:acyl-CoA hydrolase
MDTRPEKFSDEAALADKLIERLNGNIVLALPLGLGKANLIANALYARAANDTTISLTILTALTLETPHGTSRLEQRFIDPIRERIFGNYPDPAFAKALRHGTLPSNIKVYDFFLPAGRWLGVPSVQQNYIATNYTHVARTLLDRGLNVIAQMVARNDDLVSLSCNADLTPDLLQARQAGTADFLFLGEVNQSLPFMHGDAEIPVSEFDYLLEGPHCTYPLFAPPKPSVTMADYAAGFWIARLIQDGGTLQIGIGSIGDAVAQALILRHRHNPVFREIVLRLSAKAPNTVGLIQDTTFESGLFGLSEMLVDSFLPLIDAGVVKREIDGALIEAAFFVGPRAFYDSLRNMPDAERQQIRMKPVSWTNSLYRDEDRKRKARVKARFINNAMMATLLGAVVSDSLEDGRVVSGVGGQYDFVAQAFALDGARSVIALNSTRMSNGRVRSNILWSYGNQTIPRHLRDIIVTEYGVADLRGRTDAEVIAAMLAISDSRFQDDLLAQAKQARKIDNNYEIPVQFRDNTPQRIVEVFDPAQSQGHLPPYPFGSDFTDTEQRLIPALKLLKNTSSSRYRLGRHMLRGMKVRHASHTACLQRLGLLKPNNPADWAYRFLILDALATTRSDQSALVE